MTPPETVVRGIQPADYDEVAALTAKVFARPGSERETAQRIALAYRACPFVPEGLGLVAVRAGRIVAKLQGLDFDMRVGATPVKIAGLHAVLVDPAIDGEGLAWTMVPEGLALLASRGYDFIVGFAQRGAPYAALGGRPLSAEYAWRADAWRVPKDAGTFKDAGEGDVARIVAFSEAAQARRSASLVRTPAMWPWLERRPPVVWIAEGGYLGIRDDEGAVEVREACGSSPAFYRAALAKIGAHAEARGVRTIRGHLPPDHPLVQASLDRGASVTTEYARRTGMLGAVLDAGSLLPKLAPELEDRLHASRFADRKVTLKVRTRAPVESACALTVGTPRGRPVRLRIAIGGGELAQLLVGYKSAAWIDGAEFRGEDDRGPLDEAVLSELLDTLFPRAMTFMQHTDRW
jgi:predicted N-acetyltransferase YhbS